MLGYGKFVDMREGMRYDFNCIHMIEEYFRKEGKDKKECERYTESFKKRVREAKDKKECERYTESFKKRVREALKEEDRRLEEEDLWNYNDEGHRRWCKTVFEGIYSDEVMERYRLQEWWHFRYLDGRDCTGQWFTTDIKVFKIKELDRTIVYHIQHRDI